MPPSPSGYPDGYSIGNLDFDWESGSPISGIQQDWYPLHHYFPDSKIKTFFCFSFFFQRFSMVSTGFIKSDDFGMHYIDVVSDNGARVYLNEKMVLDNWKVVGISLFYFPPFLFSKTLSPSPSPSLPPSLPPSLSPFLECWRTVNIDSRLP